MTIIVCVILCLISAAKVEITWQVVCGSERPLQRCSTLSRPITDADRRVVSSSRRHADGKQSILKIRRAAKRTSRRVVVVRSVKRDLSVLIFRCSLLDLSLVALTKSSLSDSNLPLIYHSEKWVQTGSTPPPRSTSMHSLQCWTESLVRLISLWAAFVSASFSSRNLSIQHLWRRYRSSSASICLPETLPMQDTLLIAVVTVSRGSCRSDVKHFQDVNRDLTLQHVATTDGTFMRLGQNSSLKIKNIWGHFSLQYES